jgi:transcription termination factor Rho
MPVLERSALEDSPLADLHAIASELGIDGFRRLRKEELIDAIAARQNGEQAPASAEQEDGDEAPARPRRRRGGRGRGPREERTTEPASDVETEAEAAARERARPERSRPERDKPERARAERGAKSERARPERGEGRDEERGAPERTAEGVVSLVDNGSGFVRVSPPDASDDDVYISAAQVRRCELVDGDRVSGPVRPPRRSERFASLVRVDTINGRPADQVSEGVRFDELPAAFPSERFAFGVEDPTVKAIEFLTPFGRGSRVTIAGAAHTGKSEALRRLADALSTLGDELEQTVVLAGARPEEIAEWREGSVAPAAALSFAAPADAQAQAVERAIDQGKRVAARGGHAVVLIDTLDGLPAAAARKALAAARSIPGGGSLTVIATASAPLGGETTVVALDAELAGTRSFPAIDLLASRTLRPELLVGEAGAAAIAEAVREES